MQQEISPDGAVDTAVQAMGESGAGSGAGSDPEAGERRKWLVRGVLFSAGLAVGALIGGSGGMQAASDLEAARAEVREAESAARQAEADADARVAEFREQFTGQYEDRVAAVEAREKAAAAKEAELAAVQEAVDANRIEPGTYLVPEEVQPGRYRTVNEVTGGCYMAQMNGNDIVNNLGEDAGRPVFTVEAIPGTTFVVDRDCGPVQRI
jgi:hypothetical protein